MFLTDMHTHSIYSFDGRSTPEEMVEMAKKQGLSALALTEHCDFFPDSRCLHYQKVEERCQKEMAMLKQRETALRLLYGVELGQPQQNPQAAKDLLSRFDYDVVIGSVHALSDGRDIYETPYPNANACRDVLTLYFADLRKLLAFGDFDTLGHLDYPLRVMQGAWENPTLAEYREQVALVLKELARQDKALEINTKGCRSWLQNPGPEKWALELFRHYGGQKITLGSDAHEAAVCGAGIKEGMALAKAAGFHRVAIFEKRMPVSQGI